MTDKTRIDILVENVDEGQVVCDVGADHGITAIRVLEERRPKKVIASDISARSLQKLVDKINLYGYDITTRVCDGIEDLAEFQPSTIIISGMGGFLIAEILERGKDLAKTVDKFILQANNGLAHLRKYLLDSGYEILKEDLVFEDGIYYDVIMAAYTGKRSEYGSEYEYEYGRYLIENRDPLLKDKILKKLEEIESILKVISKGKGDKIEARAKALRDEEDHLEEILKCL